MQNLSVTQQYFVCTVNGKGKISNLNTEKRVCLVAAGLLELQMEAVIELNQKKASAIRELPQKLNCLSPLFCFIRERTPVKIERILEEYCYSLTDKRLNELMASIGKSLVEMGCVHPSQSGMFGTQTVYIPRKETLGRIVDWLRAELLEKGAVTEDAAALAVLLDRSRTLKLYFSAFEQKELREKLKIMSQSPAGKQVKAMVEYVENLIALMTVLMVSH